MPTFVWNIPNAITIIRLILVPFASFPLLPLFGQHNLTILVVVFIAFMLAAITDYVDGYFARKLNQHTEWGAYVDPLIDKFLIWALYLVFILIPQMNIPVWTFVVILARDLSVTEMRNYALKHNITFKTSVLAKCKTALQMLVGGMILGFLMVTYYLNQQAEIPVQNYLQYWQNNILFVNFSANLVAIVSIFTGITGIDYGYTLYKEINNNNK